MPKQSKPPTRKPEKKQGKISQKQRMKSRTKRPHQIHPNSLKNLNPFVPGISGNPGGQQRGIVYISEAYKRLMALSPEDLKKHVCTSVAEEIAMKQVRNARGESKVELSLPSAREISDRTEGRAKQQIEHSGEVTIDSFESRRDWAEKQLATWMTRHKQTREQAIASLRKAGAAKMLEYLGE